jgi:hypothetical protein
VARRTGRAAGATNARTLLVDAFAPTDTRGRLHVERRACISTVLAVCSLFTDSDGL